MLYLRLIFRCWSRLGSWFVQFLLYFASKNGKNAAYSIRNPVLSAKSVLDCSMWLKGTGKAEKSQWEGPLTRRRKQPWKIVWWYKWDGKSIKQWNKSFTNRNFVRLYPILSSTWPKRAATPLRIPVYDIFLQSSDTTISGMGIELTSTDTYHLSMVKKKVQSGKYFCEPEIRKWPNLFPPAHVYFYLF